jgi:hypothetical protein
MTGEMRDSGYWMLDAGYWNDGIAAKALSYIKNNREKQSIISFR